jgi:GrpB-like predicted nucleotidyltransferase (UPF0157 family)
LKRGVVRLAPHSARWAALFDEEARRLREAIGEYVLDIQHVGSTAIPGIVAKPILDIAVAVSSFEEAVVCVEPVVRLGYEYRGENGIPRRHYFTKGEPRTHHLHMVEINGKDWKEMIAFRDALLHDPKLADEYALLKAELARRFPKDREAYTEGKAAFVAAVVNMTRENTGESG